MKEFIYHSVPAKRHSIGIMIHVPLSCLCLFIKSNTSSIVLRLTSSYIFGGSILFNLNGEYSSINGLYAKTDNARQEDGEIMFYDENDNLLAALSLEADMLPQEFNVDVTNVLQLKIEMSGGFTALIDPIIQ